MASKYHYPPISGGDRKALTKELSKARAMTKIFAERSAEKRREGEALIREADNLSCQSWNEKMWSDGGPIDPSPTNEVAVESFGLVSYGASVRTVLRRTGNYVRRILEGANAGDLPVEQQNRIGKRTMLLTTGTLVFLAVVCVTFEAIGSAAFIGAVGIWMVSRGT
jgi:hypothetical protein